MGDEWYYAQDHDILGPVSAERLKELAAGGQLQPTDVVWKNQSETGVPAAKVKHLFSAAPAEAPAGPVKSVCEVVLQAPSVAPAEPAPDQGPAPAEAMLAKNERPSAGDAPKPQQPAARKLRVISAKGAVVLSQDGKDVRVRKKCIKCGQDDRATTTLAIRPGAARTTFYCPRCKKLQPVEVQGCA